MAVPHNYGHSEQENKGLKPMNRCNYCDLRSIKRRAKEGGLLVTVLRDADWGMGGVNIYVHPQGVNVKELQGGEDGERSKYRQAWFMSLPDSCACD
jgi:hypothetical protein